MKKKIAKLVEVVSIIAILLTLVFCYLCVTGKVETEQFLVVFSVVTTSYFLKKKDGPEEDAD